VSGLPDQIEDYAYNALGALRINAGIALDHQRPRLDAAGFADAALPNTFNGQPVTIDGVGRVTALDGKTFTYTKPGQLSRVTAGLQSASYIIDSFNRRVGRFPSTGTSELFIHEGEDMVATQGWLGPIMDRYFYDGIDHPLRLMRAGGAVYYELE